MEQAVVLDHQRADLEAWIVRHVGLNVPAVALVAFLLLFQRFVAGLGVVKFVVELRQIRQLRVVVLAGATAALECVDLVEVSLARFQ